MQPTDPATAFGELLRQRRRAHRLSQEALAELAQLSPTGVGRIERGERSPTIRCALQLARALGLSLAELVTAPGGT